MYRIVYVRIIFGCYIWRYIFE